MLEFSLSFAFYFSSSSLVGFLNELAEFTCNMRSMTIQNRGLSLMDLE
jgi:hypothetical protein